MGGDGRGKETYGIWTGGCGPPRQVGGHGVGSQCTTQEWRQGNVLRMRTPVDAEGRHETMTACGMDEEECI